MCIQQTSVRKDQLFGIKREKIVNVYRKLEESKKFKK